MPRGGTASRWTGERRRFRGWLRRRGLARRCLPGRARRAARPSRLSSGAGPPCGIDRGSVVFINPRGAGELGAHRREPVLFLLGGPVAGEGPAVSVEQVGLVEFPDLEPEGVLDRVAALLAETVGPDMAVFDQVVAAVAEPSQDRLKLLAGRDGMRGLAQGDLGHGADIAQLADTPVTVVVGDAVGGGDAAGGLAEQRGADPRFPPGPDHTGVQVGGQHLAPVELVLIR